MAEAGETETAPQTSEEAPAAQPEETPAATEPPKEPAAAPSETTTTEPAAASADAPAAAGADPAAAALLAAQFRAGYMPMAPGQVYPGTVPMSTEMAAHIPPEFAFNPWVAGQMPFMPMRYPGLVVPGQPHPLVSERFPQHQEAACEVCGVKAYVHQTSIKEGVWRCPACTAGASGGAVVPHAGGNLVPSESGASGSATQGQWQRRRGYWSDFKNVELELRDFLARCGNRTEPGRMPTQKELREGGASGSLKDAIRIHGGTTAVADRLGLRSTCPAPKDGQRRRPRGFWQDFANVERETLQLLQEQGITGRLPTIAELKAAGRLALGHAFYVHGGPQAVAERMGLARLKGSTSHSAPRTDEAARAAGAAGAAGASAGAALSHMGGAGHPHALMGFPFTAGPTTPEAAAAMTQQYQLYQAQVAAAAHAAAAAASQGGQTSGAAGLTGTEGVGGVGTELALGPASLSSPLAGPTPAASAPTTALSSSSAAAAVASEVLLGKRARENEDGEEAPAQLVEGTA